MHRSRQQESQAKPAPPARPATLQPKLRPDSSAALIGHLCHTWGHPAWNGSARHTAEGCGAGAASCAVLGRRYQGGLILAMITSLIFSGRGTICAWPKRFEGDPGGRLDTGGDGSRMGSSCVVLDGHNGCTRRAEHAGTRLQYSTATGAATFGHVEDFEGYSGIRDVMRSLSFPTACRHKRMACSRKD
jgi:hypothetical protein